MSQDRLRAEIERFDPSVPIEAAWTPPCSWYTDPEIFALERAAVFRHSWQPVARVDQLAEPGSYVSGCFVDQPWVVVRGADGELRAFHNVCRHKGREVVTGQGKAAALVCGYHNWTYDLSGALRMAPRMTGIENFDRSKMSLLTLQVECWGPWVFVNWDRQAVPLSGHVRELTDRLEGTGWGGLVFAGSSSWTIQCNWKVFVDNYLDGGYHVPYMHPSLDAQIDMGTYRTELFEKFSIQSVRPRSEPDKRIDYEPGQRIGDEAIYAWIYPNLMVNRYGPCLDSNHVVPLGPDRCRVDYEFYFAGAVGDGDDAFVRASMEQADVTQREDLEISESVQIGLRSGAYDRGRYAPRVEMGEHHFHCLLQRALAAKAP